MDGSTEGSRPAPRRRRLRVVAIVVAVLAAVAAVPFAIRANGRSLLSEVRARHAAAGLGTTARDLAAILPRPNPDLQRRFDAAERALVGKLRPFTVRTEEVEEWIVGLRDDPPPSLDAALESIRPVMEPYAAILREERLLLGNPSCLPLNEATPNLPLRVLTSLSWSGVHVSREAAWWLRHAALRAADPGPHLDALDGQRRASFHPASLIDAMGAVAISGDRDRAYVELALVGRLPSERAAKWLAEEPDHLRLGADGLRGERLLFTNAVADGLSDGSIGAEDVLPIRRSTGSPARIMTGLRARSDLWLHGMEDAARLMEMQADAEVRLRGLPGTLDPATAHSWTEDSRPWTLLGGGGVYQSAQGYLYSYRGSAFDGRTTHRMARLVVRTLAFRTEQGRLPASERELRAWLGAAAASMDLGHLDLRIRYENPAAGVLRLAPDMTSLPASFPGLKRAGPMSLFGSAASGKNFRWGPVGIEVHLAR